MRACSFPQIVRTDQVRIGLEVASIGWVPPSLSLWHRQGDQGGWAGQGRGRAEEGSLGQVGVGGVENALKKTGLEGGGLLSPASSS